MTTKSTIPVNGGAMPKFNRKAIMARAWAIFRETYKYPSIKFSSIGWSDSDGRSGQRGPRLAKLPALQLFRLT
jgi:hypothetical protein